MNTFINKLLITVAVAGLATVAVADEFTRIASNAHGNATALQLAIATYGPASGDDELAVDLIGAIHVADRSYYDKLNDRFGAYDEAERTLLDALGRCRALRIRRMEGYALANLGYALCRQGRDGEAAAALSDAADLAAEIGEQRLALTVRVYRARLGALTDPDRAAGDAAAAADDARAAGDRALEGLARAAEAAARLAAGDPEEACRAAEAAMAIRDRLGGMEEDEAELFVTLSRALRERGREAEAAEVRYCGRRRVDELASHIADTASRDRFLADVEAHRVLTGLP